MRPTKQWPPEIDAIISDRNRVSVNAMTEIIRQWMPDVTRSMVKWRRYRLMKAAPTKRFPGIWDLAVYTDERTEYLHRVWETFAPFQEIRAGWDALPGKPTGPKAIYTHAQRLGLSRPNGKSKKTGRPRNPAVKTDKGIYNARDAETITHMIRRGSDAFGEAFAAAGLWFDDHPDLSPAAVAPVQRRGIMTGPDPRTADLIAARVAMAARSRLAVADVGVRGLV